MLALTYALIVLIEGLFYQIFKWPFWCSGYIINFHRHYLSIFVYYIQIIKW